MNIKVTVEELQAAGFPMGGEPLVALDLADTVMTVKDPPVDLIGDPAAGAVWWSIQARRLPPGPAPAAAAVRRLRTAIRDVLDAHVEGREADPASVEDINATASSVPRSPRLVTSGQGMRQETRWHIEHGGNAALAAIAGEVIGLLAGSERLVLLRRCESSDCSMLFLAENKRRKWCVGNICGNRARVARHYGRTHSRDT